MATPVVRPTLGNALNPNPVNAEYQSGVVNYEAITTENHQPLRHLVPKELLNQRTLLTQETLHKHNHKVLIQLAIFGCAIHLLKPGLGQADNSFIRQQSGRLQQLVTAGHPNDVQTQFVAAYTAPNAFIEWKQELLGAASIVQVLRGTAN